MKTVIHIRTDKEVKENAQKVAAELGLSLSHVINASLRNLIRTRQVIFSDIPRMTPELEQLLGRVEKDINNKKNLSPKFDDIDKAIEYLHSQ
ncbi:hypothetical protein A3D78_02520 [Candidatus Gottesmanbacteria bacterium RIFCSPHIGHO2_02_FULL_39_14]|uniref:Damage-inducible protein J n=2 Tax=Candidatus Gottesmaniibacteriota TaxID=1752720 RepID=A0A1F5ZTS7_9BACT|nr:MAG: hypothetical protein A3D78_02520 [Candidatus Gottesmanbacteria bacterium RIFCSPHIGHO2_02_FULL_39_14]OGG32426.1 MAG: hypothetical protein A3I51_06075 [Candidatus Gottesmanbacteria bacterium RIFCSPLOWO2_02_FULL_38_8]